MSVYLLVPLLLQSAPALDQRNVAEPAASTPSLACCAAGSASNDHSDFQLGRTATFVMASTEESPSGPVPATEELNAVPAQSSADVQQAGPVPADGGYSFRVFRKQAASIPLRFGAATAAITIGGFSNWNWGSSQFRFNSEGWFEKDTSSMGMDKLGHAYSAYVLTEFFSDGIQKRSGHSRHSAYTGAVLSMALMTYIEVFDGFSQDHGFSHEDLVADAAGALFSIARRSVPGLREKVDFRLLYVPSASTWDALSCFPEPHCDRDGEAVRGPFTDYAAQRYLVALKLSGFEPLERTPLRLLELHAGYYARGFTKEEEDRGDPLKRRLFVGLGLNVGELLLPGRRRGVAGLAKWALQYLQVPYTAVHSE